MKRKIKKEMPGSKKEKMIDVSATSKALSNESPPSLLGGMVEFNIFY